MNYYLMILRPEPMMIGPFHDEQQRNDYAAALWFGEPAKEPWRQRGERQRWFDRNTMTLYYITSDGRIYHPRNVTVGELSKGKAAIKHRERRKRERAEQAKDAGSVR